MQLLRIEGVNLANCIDDTEDLSTRRGGSLMLLFAIQTIEEVFKTELDRISTGASVGLFSLKANAGDNIVARTRDQLAQDKLYRHGTYVVDVVVDVVDGTDPVKGFRAGVERSIAKNRWRQMQSLSFSSVGLQASAAGVCEVDDVRPAHGRDTVKAKKQTPVSTSVADRRGLRKNDEEDQKSKDKRDYRDHKRRLYAKLLDPAGEYAQIQNLNFANDFEVIAKDLPQGVRPDSLEGKIAVFYADGNKFGRIARHCKDSAALCNWDVYLKAERNKLLAKIVHCASLQKPWQTSTGVLRIETLLWGGDELMFVVPGWCGLELAKLFFEQTGDMRYEAAAPPELTHACGLVFCHHQAPISRVSKIAKLLAEEGKKLNKKLEKNSDSLHWLVLESFDHAGGKLDAYLARRFPFDAEKGQAGVIWAALGLDPNALAQLCHSLPSLQDVLPRSAIVRIVRMLAEHSGFTADGKPDPLLKRSYKQVNVALQSEEAAMPKFEELWKALSHGDWSGEQAAR